MNATDHRIYKPEIRFGDIDAAGIVNNAVFLTYFEQSRIAYFAGLVGREWDWHHAGMVVVRHEVDYRRPIPFGADATIYTWTQAVGTKSVTFAYEVWLHAAGQNHLSAEARTTLVCFDHAAGHPIAVPDAWKAAMASEGFARPDHLMPQKDV